MIQAAAKTVLLSVLVLVVTGTTAFGEPQKVLLDTDIGGDIDDAFALALILASDELELVGVTVGHGMTSARARVACRMLYETGNADIPVAVGRPTGRIAGQDTGEPPYQPQFHWAEDFTETRPIQTPAGQFIVETLQAHPGEIDLITVGPVTNVGDLLKREPEALHLAKHIYSMFGSFYMGYGSDPVPDAEWNVRADVTAAQALAASGAEITYAGLDITTFVKLNAERRQQLQMRGTPLTDALSALYTLWGHETPTLYDVVAVGMVLWPELFRTRPAHVRVIDGGYTIIDESRAANSRVGMAIRQEEFLRRMMDRYLQQEMHR